MFLSCGIAAVNQKYEKSKMFCVSEVKLNREEVTTSLYKSKRTKQWNKEAINFFLISEKSRNPNNPDDPNESNTTADWVAGQGFWCNPESEVDTDAWVDGFCLRLGAAAGGGSICFQPHL